jgi:hypothetical protein
MHLLNTNANVTPRQREEGQKTLKAKEEMEAAKQRRDIDAMAREKREAKEKQVSACIPVTRPRPSTLYSIACAGAHTA